MALQIGDAIGDGIRRAFSRSGGVLVALMFGYLLVFMGALNAIVLEYLPADGEGTDQFALAFPVPAAVAGVLLGLSLLFGLVVSIAATRALTRDHAERSTVPSELFTRCIGRAMVSMLGAMFLVNPAVSVGFVLLFVPGTFLMVSFMFAVYAIGVEDERAIDSLSRSWQLATGDRWRLFGLTLVVTVGAGIVAGLSGLVTAIEPVVGQEIYLAALSVVVIVANGILADAYVQLRDDDEAGGTGGTEAPEAPGAAV
jgi:hypothetical protein